MRLEELPSVSVPEGATIDYEANLVVVSATGASTPLAGTDLDALTLTVVHGYSGEVINDRDEQDVLNTNGVTVNSQGRLVWRVTPEDTAIVNDALTEEPHRCQFRWTYGAKAGSYEFVLLVQNTPRPEGA